MASQLSLVVQYVLIKVVSDCILQSLWKELFIGLQELVYVLVAIVISKIKYEGQWSVIIYINFVVLLWLYLIVSSTSQKIVRFLRRYYLLLISRWCSKWLTICL
jgi:hypothetical protein